MKRASLHTDRQGFSLVEILVALGVFLLSVTAIAGTAGMVSKTLRRAGNFERATYLAEEAVEASRNLRDAASSFSELPNGTHGLVAIGGQWNLTGTSDTDGTFTRSLEVSSFGPRHKKVRATVTWSDAFSPQPGSVSLDAYLTDWRGVSSLGLTMNKTVVNHGGSKVPSDFLPTVLTTDAWDYSSDPPVTYALDVPIAFSPSVMALGPGTYTFLTTNDPAYSLTLSSDCAGGTVTLADGDSKTCDVTYEEYAAPEVTTPTVSAIGTTTATLGATLVSAGNPAFVTARGTCWGLTPAPTTNCLADSSTSTGAFAQARTGFVAGVTYYFRGYATNATGTGYSADGTFTTNSPLAVPTVTTSTVSAIGTTTATLGATLVSAGNPAFVTARGTCWGLTPAPTTNCLADSSTSTGAFAQARTGFVAGVTYYFRGYATNATGTGYSADGTFRVATGVFTVTASNSSNYQISTNGGPNANDPNLTLLRGRRYVFNVNAPTHPFWIKFGRATKVTGTGNAYTTGVQNNGTGSGQIIFDVPLAAPANDLYYICQDHSAQNGNLNTLP